MDAPPIQYTRAEDGVNIAYWTLDSANGHVAHAATAALAVT